jgi:acetyl esterase
MRKWLLWTLGGVVALVGAAYLAFTLSPWPSALIIREIFNRGGAAMAAEMAPHVPTGVVSTLDIAYGEGRDEVLDIFRPEAATQPLPTIVWVHGGAWIAGDKAEIANYLKIIAAQDYTVVGVNYTLAPTARYPEPVEQVSRALAFLVANADDFGIDATRIALAGDSAGGHIAAQLANITTAPAYAAAIGIPPALAPEQLRAMLLFCGAYNLDLIDFDGGFSWFLRSVLWSYTGSQAPDNQGALATFSVAAHVTPQFPPAFITAGNDDPLEAQSHDMAEKLEAQGVVVDTLFYPDDHSPPLPHEYQFLLDGGDAQIALTRLLAFLQTHL